MNKSLKKLPKAKQEELSKLSEVVSAYKEVEMIILFGSYANYSYFSQHAIVQTGFVNLINGKKVYHGKN